MYLINNGAEYFYMFTGHQYFYFWEVPLHIFCHFLPQLNCLFIDLQSFFLCILDANSLSVINRAAISLLLNCDLFLILYKVIEILLCHSILLSCQDSWFISFFFFLPSEKTFPTQSKRQSPILSCKHFKPLSFTLKYLTHLEL